MRLSTALTLLAGLSSTFAVPLGNLVRRAIIDCGSDPTQCPTAGPSGQVIQPVGGTQVTQTTNGGDGLIFLNYTTVYQQSPLIFTQNINVTLVQNGGNQRYHLAALGPLKAGENIVANLATPEDACGTFNLFIEEQQFAATVPGSNYGAEFRFLAAAPLISISCVQYNTQAPPTTIVYRPTTVVTTLTEVSTVTTYSLRSSGSGSSGSVSMSGSSGSSGSSASSGSSISAPSSASSVVVVPSSSSSPVPPPSSDVPSTITTPDSPSTSTTPDTPSTITTPDTPVSSPVAPAPSAASV